MTESNTIHDLLSQQLARHIGESVLPSHLLSFLSEIDETYKAYDSIIRLYELK